MRFLDLIPRLRFGLVTAALACHNGSNFGPLWQLGEGFSAVTDPPP